MYKNFHLLTLIALISSSGYAHSSPEKLAELLRKKYIHEYEISVESQRVIEENHELLASMLESRNIHQEVLEFLDAMAFLHAKNGKPHSVYSKDFSNNITNESNRMAQEEAEVAQDCARRTAEASTYERHIKIAIAKEVADKYSNAAWKAVVAQYAFLIFSEAIQKKAVQLRK